MATFVYKIVVVVVCSNCSTCSSSSKYISWEKVVGKNIMNWVNFMNIINTRVGVKILSPKFSKGKPFFLQKSWIERNFEHFSCSTRRRCHCLCVMCMFYRFVCPSRQCPHHQDFTCVLFFILSFLCDDGFCFLQVVMYYLYLSVLYLRSVSLC